MAAKKSIKISVGVIGVFFLLIWSQQLFSWKKVWPLNGDYTPAVNTTLTVNGWWSESFPQRGSNSCDAVAREADGYVSGQRQAGRSG